MLEAARLDDFEYVCLDSEISTDLSKPSIFDILASYEMRRGLPVYDPLQWKTNVMGFDAYVLMQGQAVGYLNGGEFAGFADFRSILTVAEFSGHQLETHFLTEFSFAVDGR